MAGKSFLLLLLTFLSVSSYGQRPAGVQQPNQRPSDAKGRKVCVLGDVVKPSEVSFERGLSVAHAIEGAGGIVGRAKSKKVRVFSGMAGSGEMRQINLDRGATGKRPYRDLELQAFDVVEVYSPKKAKRVPVATANPCPSVIPESLWRAPRL